MKPTFQSRPLRVMAPCVLAVLAVIITGCASSGVHEVSKSERAALYLQVANSALGDGDTVTALEQLNHAQELDSSLEPQIHHARALVYAYKHDMKTALVEAKKAVDLDPKFTVAFNTYGKLLMDAGRYDEAIPQLVHAGQDPLNREAYKAWTNLGILYYRRMSYDRARDSLKLAIQSSPTLSCIAYYYLGHIEMQKANLPEAVRDYDKASRGYCTNFGDAHLALGIAYERNRQYKKARGVFLEVRDQFASSALSDQAMNHLKHLP